MKRAFRKLRALLALGALLSSQTILPLRPVRAAAGQVCASPGKDGLGNGLSGTVNTYYPGIGTVSAGAKSIPVGTSTGAASQIAAGDLLLVIQMQDATINPTNTDAYGDGSSGDVPALVAGGTQPANGASGYLSTTAGTYEYVVATGPVSSGAVAIKGVNGGGLLNSYSSAAATPGQGQKTYQVVRVPQYSSATLGSPTASPWNGSTGGILAYDVSGNLNLSGTVDVSGKGFRGGGGRRLSGDTATPTLRNTDFVTAAARNANGSKGEGIAGRPRYLYNGTATLDDFLSDSYPGGSSGRGAPGNAGGGSTDGNPSANDQNSGGGGGSNGGSGGIGGRTWSSNLPTGGFGGKAFPASTSRLILGGGGGAGTTNDGTSTPNTNTTGINSSGAAGGGMVMIRTNTVSGTGTINANGANALNVLQDGGGGGGAGGSVLVAAQSNSLTGLTVNANGGKGGNAVFTQPHGPGGGGGGGVVIASPGVTINEAGGASGFTGSPATSNTNGGTSGSGLAIPLALSSIPGASSGAECVPVLTTAKSTSTSTVTNTPSGTTATYTITVANEVGRSTASNVVISDSLPTGFTYASGATATLNGGAVGPTSPTNSGTAAIPAFGSYTIPGGGSVALTFTVNIASSVANNTYDNSATATYDDPAGSTAGVKKSASYDGTLSSNPAENVTVTSPNLRITKSDGGNDFSAGGTGSYTLTVNNTGTAATSGQISVTDTLPTGLTVANGTVSLSGTNAANWSCSATNNVITCTSSTAIAASGSSSFSFNVGVNSNAPTPVTNTANVTGGGEPTANNTDNSGSDSTTITSSPDLTITKSDGGNIFSAGGTGSYTLTVNNTGTAATSGQITVTDTLPTGLTVANGTVSLGGTNATNWSCSATNNVITCTSSTAIAAGGNSRFSFNVGVNSNAPALVNNTANVTGGGEPTANNTNNSGSDTTTITSSPDLTITKSDGNNNFSAGGTGSYTLTVNNTGTAATSGQISVTDTLPTGLTVANGTVNLSGTNAANWSCSATNNVITCTSSTPIAAGGNSRFSFNVGVNSNAPALVNNTASVAGGGEPTANNTNNSGSDSTTITSSPDLTITKSDGNNNFSAGGTGSYTLTVNNTGTAATSGQITVTDTLPTGLTVANGTVSLGGTNATNWSCSATNNVITCTSSTPIAAGGSSSFSFNVGVNSNAPTPVTNTASVAGGGEPTANNTNNSGSDDTTIAPANISLSGTVFEDVNYGGGAGRNYNTANSSAIASGFSSGAIRRPKVRVELYNTAGSFITSTLTDSNGAYTFSNQPANANYTVRVVNSTVISVRAGAVASLIGVQTYRTTATGGTAVAVTDFVGGENPTLVDAGNGSTTLAALTTGTTTAQSLAAVSAGTTNITGLDFGFNFDTIVNTRDSGQGSLRQFIINSNTLNNANLAQTGTGLILGRETSIFMLSDSAVRPGLRAGLPNQFSSGVATITLATALPAIAGSNAANTAIDGSRQTAVTGNTNLPVSEVTTGPEIVINVSAGPGLEIRAANTIISDLGITGANGVGTTGAGVYFNGTGVSGSRIQNSTIFSNDESGVTLQSATRVRVSNNITRNNGVTQRLADGIEMIGAVDNTITDNEILNNPGYGIDLHTTANSSNTISLNLIKNNGNPDNSQDAGIGLRLGNNNIIDFNSISGNFGDGIVVVSGTGNKISRNSTFANGGLGIDLSGGTEGDGVTLNESGDGDTGANGLLNFPILESAKISGGNLILTGFARPGSTIELFVADLDPSSFGEGQQFVATLVEGSSDDTDSDTGNYGPAPVNGIAQGTDNTNRFRFTIPAGAVSISSVLTATATDSNGSTSEFSGYATVVSATPKMSLVKRITAVNGTPLLGFDGTATDPNGNSDTSEDANWPTPFDTYLRGRIDGGFVKPGDEVEYTIYFLNSENPATNVAVCDPVPANLTFVANGYNSAVPHSVEAGALPSETGIALGLDDATLPTSPTVYLTNVNDSDRGRYYPPNDSQTPSVCASNTNGAVVVNVVTGTTTLPNATTPGTPANSYGFIRFKVKVK